ncbi:MAG: sodium:solute symporter family protein [Planctomycetota bacterium]
MNLHWIDWTIVIGMLTFTTVIAFATKKYTSSVADFLVANRCAGRYVLAVGGGIAGLGAITIMARFEMCYENGFSPTWWVLMGLPIGLIITLSGWVIYRFRQTRVLTMAQFFEVRYSRRLRIFMGFLSFLSGILNFGIFPAVGGRFFIYFCGLPDTVDVLGLKLSTFALVMLILLSVALLYTFLGGQITVILTDFFQGMFCSIVFPIMLVVLLYMFDWSKIVETLATTAPENASMLHPFKTGDVKTFNVWYFAIGAFGAFYASMTFQGGQGYSTSSTTPHEIKMARIIDRLRDWCSTVVILLLPICAYMVMHHPDYASIAESVKATISTISNERLQTQMTVPVAIAHILPTGLMGAFCAVMLAAFISTHDTYLHSWGSVFIQDVVMPLRKKPFTPKQHIRLLRLSILGVAVFIFFFSLWFKQTQYIFMYFAITGAIYGGGAGSVLIGGLYWKRGTTAAAWCSMIVGSTLAVSGVLIHALHKDFFITGQVMWFIAMVSSIIVYVVVSLLGKRHKVDLDHMLHRGKYAVKQDTKIADRQPVRGWKALGMGKEFTRSDKIIYMVVLIWALGWWAAFLIVTAYNLTHDVKTESWAKFWHFKIWLFFIIGVVQVVWFAVGGIRDIRNMVKALRKAKRNSLDDGRVVDHHNLAEEFEEN